MAITSSFTAALAVVGTGLSVAGSSSKSITNAGSEMMGNVQIIGTTAEALDLQDISTIGYLYLKNDDATNFISIGIANPPTGASEVIRLLAGEFCFFPTRQATIYAKADTAQCNLFVVAVEL